MALTRPVIIPPWAETGDKSAQPSDSEIQGGWPLTTTPPSRQKFNWLLNFLANAVRYLVNRGGADWSSSETYGVGAVVIGNDNKLYRSLQVNNLNKQPSTQSDWWSIFTESADLWDRLTANGIDANLGVTNHLPNINVDPFLIPEGYFDVSTSGDKPFAYGICRTRKEDNTVIYQFAQSSTNGDFATRMYRESIGGWTAWKYYANLSGSTAEFFNVKTATSDDHAPTFKQLTDGLATKAAKAGNNTQAFKVATAVDDDEAIRKDAFDAKTALATDTVAGIVEKATLSELIAATANKYPDAALLLSGFDNQGASMDLPSFLGGYGFRWGFTTATVASEGTITVVFSKDFPAACMHASAIYSNPSASSSGVEDIWVQFVSADKHGATFYLQSHIAQPTQARTISWFAFGR